MEDINYNVLNPIYRELWDLLSEEDMLKIFKEFRGTQLQLSMKLYDRKALSKWLIEHPSDLSVRELSDKYGYAPRWIKEQLNKRDGEK